MILQYCACSLFITMFCINENCYISEWKKIDNIVIDCTGADLTNKRGKQPLRAPGN